MSQVFDRKAGGHEPRRLFSGGTASYDSPVSGKESRVRACQVCFDYTQLTIQQRTNAMPTRQQWSQLIVDTFTPDIGHGGRESRAEIISPYGVRGSSAFVDQSKSISYSVVF